MLAAIIYYPFTRQRRLSMVRYSSRSAFPSFSTSLYPFALLAYPRTSADPFLLRFSSSHRVEAASMRCTSFSSGWPRQRVKQREIERACEAVTSSNGPGNPNGKLKAIGSVTSFTALRDFLSYCRYVTDRPVIVGCRRSPGEIVR